MTDLKPCPFCGEKEAIRLTSWQGNIGKCSMIVRNFDDGAILLF